jgi:serine/threonine protein kinase
MNILDVFEADKRIVKYEVGDNVITSEFHWMGSKYYLKEFKTLKGMLEIIRESDMYTFVKSLDTEASSIFPECHLFPGMIVTKAVKGVPAHSLSPETKVSRKFIYALNRVFDIFHRIGFSHGDFHGNNFYYDEIPGQIYVIDLGMSQVSSNINRFSNNWFSMVPQEFYNSSSDRIFEFFKRLDIVNGWYVFSKGVCNAFGSDYMTLYFAYLSIFIKSKYGWKVVFKYDGKNFHKCIVDAVVKSFESHKKVDITYLEEFFVKIGAIEEFGTFTTTPSKFRFPC